MLCLLNLLMKNLMLCAFALLLLSGCYTKYDDTRAAAVLQVPPYSETGANTFGCLVNGAVWANFGATIVHPAESLGSGADTNKVMSSISGPSQLSADTMFYIRATYSLDKKGKTLRQEYMRIEMPKNGSLKGTHLLTGANGLFDYQRGVLGYPYSIVARNPFTVIINKDSLVYGFRHIVSGRFYGLLYNYGQTDSVRISGGVFDTMTQ